MQTESAMAAHDGRGKGTRRYPWMALATLAVGTLAVRAGVDPAGVHLTIRVPGGMPAVPIITSVSATQGVALSWIGFGGPYRVQQTGQLPSPNSSWQTIFQANEQSAAVLSPAWLSRPASFLRITAPAPRFAGASLCRGCHPAVHRQWEDTAHASAFQVLQASHQATNTLCLPCHTVGYGLPTGFHDEISTPQLAGVQCENCHGPAADHAANPDDLARVPRVEIASPLCGGCHTGYRYPTFEEWNQSAHAPVTAAVAPSLRSGYESVLKSCGYCHSGAVRLAGVNGARALPSGPEAAAVGISCVVCHDPHQKTLNGAQLRNPVASTNFFSYGPAATNSFAAQYDPQVNLCAQCHNARGAQWTDTASPPHRSPQYNILLGNVGVTASNLVVKQSAHRTAVAGQCSECHVQQIPTSAPSAVSPNYTGHDFMPRLTICSRCHADDPVERLTTIQEFIQTGIASAKALLDQWATTRADGVLRTKYGALAWEYTAAGRLSNPLGKPDIVGPSTAEQAMIPDAVKQARFNVYLVEHDGSYGVHNAAYAFHLLQVAEAKVRPLLSP
jgi:hypothetical protein